LKAATCILFGIQLAGLVMWCMGSTPRTPTAIAAASLSLADVFMLALLLYAEHRYSQRPSTLLSLYLSLTILLDIATARSLFLRPGLHTIAALSTTAVIAKVSLLVLEEIPKRRLLTAGARADGLSAEATSGLWNRAVFWWLNSTFRRGFRALLRVDDLALVDHELRSQTLYSSLAQRWNESKAALQTFVP
jgi:ATP-binding cassette subfamily C (CFTR/MRP) protein 1